MRRPFILTVALVAFGCHQNVKVPKTDELVSNPQLLAEWQSKCDTGEYRSLPAAQKDNYCFTTREAARSVAMKKMITQ
jgi:hypothetical protein